MSRIIWETFKNPFPKKENSLFSNYISFVIIFQYFAFIFSNNFMLSVNFFVKNLQKSLTNFGKYVFYVNCL